MIFKLKFKFCNTYWVPKLRKGLTELANSLGKHVTHWHVINLKGPLKQNNYIIFGTTFVFKQGVLH